MYIKDNRVVVTFSVGSPHSEAATSSNKEMPFNSQKNDVNSFNLYSMRKPQRIDREGKNPTAVVFALLNYHTASW